MDRKRVEETKQVILDYSEHERLLEYENTINKLRVTNGFIYHKRIHHGWGSYTTQDIFEILSFQDTKELVDKDLIETNKVLADKIGELEERITILNSEKLKYDRRLDTWWYKLFTWSW